MYSVMKNILYYITYIIKKVHWYVNATINFTYTTNILQAQHYTNKNISYFTKDEKLFRPKSCQRLAKKVHKHTGKCSMLTKNIIVAKIIS